MKKYSVRFQVFAAETLNAGVLRPNFHSEANAGHVQVKFQFKEFYEVRNRL